jgi:signal transduction histidine kinase
VQLRCLQQAEQVGREDIARIAERIQEVLDRFRGILRIAELEVRHRRAGFINVDLAEVVTAVADLYLPLAESAGVRLLVMTEPRSTVEADPKLLFEALSNLVENAIKFGGHGTTVQLRVGSDGAHPRLIIQDDGPGIPTNERTAVLQRFYRSERSRPIPGSGLGLNVVASIVRLHDFELVLEDADPGVRAIIYCRPPPPASH